LVSCLGDREIQLSHFANVLVGGFARLVAVYCDS